MLKLETLKELRKSALAGDDHSQRLDELQELVRAGPSPESDLAWKVAENTIKALRRGPERARVDFVRGLALAGAGHNLVAVRRNAFNRLAELSLVLQSNSCYQEWLGIAVLDVCQGGLSDPGTDLDPHGNPLQETGTLTLADRSFNVISGLGTEARSHRLFLGALQGLKRANGFLANGSLSAVYGRKLMDKLLDILERLLNGGAPMPLAALTPAHFPNYLTELLHLAASTEYRHVPLDPIMRLICQIPCRKRYIWHMVEVVRQDPYPHLADMLWAHIAREISEGHFALELKQGLRKSLKNGHLPTSRVPEELRPLLSS